MNDILKAALKGAAIGLPGSIVASLLAQQGVDAADVLKSNIPKYGLATLGAAIGSAIGAGARGAKFVKDATIEKSIEKNRLLGAQRQVLRENGLLKDLKNPVTVSRKPNQGSSAPKSQS